MTAPTGHALAAFLRAVADHLDRHGLPIVNIHSEHAGGWTLQLIADGAAHALVAWASSLGAVDLYVHPILDKPQVSVGLLTTIEGRSGLERDERGQ